MVWYKKGSKTQCAGCGITYVQDLPQELLDQQCEFHPDIRILCPKCLPRKQDPNSSSSTLKSNSQKELKE